MLGRSWSTSTAGDAEGRRRGEMTIDHVTRVSVLRTTEAIDDPTFQPLTAQLSADPAADTGGNVCEGR